MDNYEKLIIRYLDRQLSEEEKLDFENSLLTNSHLRAEFEKYKKVNGMFSSEVNPELDNDYFSRIVPEFRQRLEKKSSPVLYRNYGMVFTTVFLIVTSFFIADKLLINRDINNSSIQAIVEGFTEEELDNFTDYYSSENYSLISDNDEIMLLADTDVNMESILTNSTSEQKISIISEFELGLDYSSIDEDRLEFAYNEIISKRIF